jgi:hypothetical protein
MLKAARAFAPDTIVHLGDLADFFSISAHSKDPSRRANLADEVRAVRAMRRQLDNLGAKTKLFIEGNHEFRLQRYLQDKAPELFEFVTTDQLLELSANDWKFTPYRESTRLGKLRLTHDVGTTGKYSTARALDTFQHSVAVGHNHAMQYHVAGDATGKYQVGAQFGWLGDLARVDYMHKVKVCRTWSLGFGVGHHEVKTGIVYVVPIPIVGYTCCINGKVFRA